MNKCESCKFCKEYKIHKRILNFIPVKIEDKTFSEKAHIYVTHSWKDFEDINICDYYGCEMDEEREECEFWEDKTE